VDASLRHGDPMERTVELSVAATVEAVALVFAGAGVERCDAGMAGELGGASYRRGRPASGQTSLEAAARLLSGHARRSREGGGDATLASQPQATFGNRVSRRQPESLAHAGRHHPETMTMSSGMSLDKRSRRPSKTLGLTPKPPRRARRAAVRAYSAG
jgi:hypothetical protein